MAHGRSSWRPTTSGWAHSLLIAAAIALCACVPDEQQAAAIEQEMPDRIFFRAFKQERVLELWGGDSLDQPLKLIETWPVAAASGALGPKRKEGDRQVPEGLYHIAHFNPESRFHLSLGLNYPNKSDRIRGDKDEPGSDIYIHGNQVSIGCLAMTDAKIEEIWAYATHARDAGQQKIPVHIFPLRMEEESMATMRSEHMAFWTELEPIYEAFEKTRLVPEVEISESGAYSLREASRP